MVKRINDLIKDIKRDPFHGIGKPESLKHNLTRCSTFRVS
ncbi:type II toxin-antitoxin system YoeB family toxin [Xenorhabdus ishibashii]